MDTSSPARAGPYLTPPESLGDALLGSVYREAGARVALLPWACDAAAADCRRYGAAAWEVRPPPRGPRR